MIIRLVPIVAAAFLLAACDNSPNDEPPVKPSVDASGATPGSGSQSEPLVTGPRGAEQNLPAVPNQNAPADSGRDSAATQPKEELTKKEETSQMPLAGQANNYMSEAMTKQGEREKTEVAQSGSSAPANAPAQDAPSGSSAGGDAAGSAAATAAGASASGGGASSGGAAQPVSPEQALALAKQHNCTSCHAVDKKLIGPSYQEVAAKYKDDAAADAQLVDKVKKGGAGVWGPVPMPPHPTVPEQDIVAIVDWVLAGAN